MEQVDSDLPSSLPLADDFFLANTNTTVCGLAAALVRPAKPRQVRKFARIISAHPLDATRRCLEAALDRIGLAGKYMARDQMVCR